MRRVICGLAVVLGCGLAPTAPGGHAALAPVPAEYAQWWQQIEQCSGLRSDFSRVTWRIYRDRDYVLGDHGRDTFVDWRTRTIYVTRLSVDQAAHIRYAMLRYLLPGANTLPPAYAEMCKGEIS